MNSIISQFIDNELNLDEKVAFVHQVSDSLSSKNETLELLQQEKRIRSAPVHRIPRLEPKVRIKPFFLKIRPLTAIAAAAVAAAIMIFLLTSSGQNQPATHRFVIYRPDVTRAEITGTFTGWSRIPMNRIGASGYWDITVNIPSGEHRFSYILDEKQIIADPTIPFRELDDFGGENSVIAVGSET